MNLSRVLLLTSSCLLACQNGLGASARSDASALDAPAAADDARGDSRGPEPDAFAGADDAAATPDDAHVEATGCAGLFCEDFEGDLDTARWTFQQASSGNTIEVQAGEVHHGASALHLHARGGSERAIVATDALPASLRTHYFGRLYMRITDFPTESGGHSAFVMSGGSLDGFPYRDHHLEVGSYTGGSTEFQITLWQGDGPEYIGAGGDFPKNRWFCLEWEFGDSPNQIAVWVDGSPQVEKRDLGPDGILGGLSTLMLGFRTWHPAGSPDIDVWIDDVELNGTRVGCR
jgi:hypothetical protein